VFPIDRVKYMAEMKALLSFMDAEDRLKVMRRYERSFDAAGREGEAALIRELGSPVRQVLMVEKEYREREEAGLPGIADEEYAEEVSVPVEAVADEAVEAGSTVEAQAAQVMEALLAEDAREELIIQPEEPTEEEAYAAEADEEYVEEALDEQEEADEGSEAPGTGRVIGAVALTPILIATALVGVVLTVLLAAFGLLPGLGLAAASVYLGLYAFNSMSFLPDVILVCGLAVVALALAIFFILLGLWLLVEGIRLTIRLISGVYGRVLRKGGADDE